MSRLVFQAKVRIETATPEPNSIWRLGLTFSDNEGVFTAGSIRAGDVVVLDTTALEAGTLTQYTVLDVIAASWMGTVDLLVEYGAANNNLLANPDIAALRGEHGIITRPTANERLLPVVSPSTQGVSDRFSFYLHNYNLNSVVDQLRSEVATGGLELITAKTLTLRSDGTALLPSRPIGDFVHDVAIVHLRDGSVVEMTDLSTVESEGHIYLKLQAVDFQAYQDLAVSVTVSYLGFTV